MSEGISVSSLVLEALALACGIDAGSIASSTRVDELVLDSLTLVAVLARIEASFGVELTEDEMLAFFEPRTVGELVAAAEALVAGRGLLDNPRPQLR